MKYLNIKSLYSLFAITGLLLALSPSPAAAAKGDDTVPVSMTVTASVASGKRMPTISQDQILVRRGKERLQVTDWTPAKGDRAGLELFVLIDDASDLALGSQLDDLRSFINAQPDTTMVGVGYMRNATVQVAQDLTADHTKAAQALRLPFGYPGVYGSPYLSVIDLMKRWPESENRHEVLMISDGVDHSRRAGIGFRGFSVNPDVETASSVAQRTGTMIHTIYFPGSGRFQRNFWELTNGQMNAANLSDKTGGESYYLGLHSPVSLAPYLADLGSKVDNQYILRFSARPGKKAGLQPIRLSTEVAGVELASHDAVWVPASR